jgi:geranylgeranyl diphosphate synthase type II
LHHFNQIDAVYLLKLDGLKSSINFSMHSYNDLVALFEQYNLKQKFDERYDVYRAMKYIMSMSSKRVRPVLALMSCELFDGNVRHALPAAFGLEVYHNSTLVHDDIMDKATTRRGNPTVHKLYGVNVAINTGDMMFTEAYKYLAKTANVNTNELFDIFNSSVIKIVKGQSLDMEFESRADVSEKEYLEMIDGKTSVLLACALQIGALIAGADKKSQKLIFDFGLNLGISFQILDDYLDAFGNPKLVGKRHGGDILLNKKTILFIKALELSSPAEKRQIDKLLTEKDKKKKLASMLALMERSGAKKYTEQLIEKYYQKSLKNLTAINVTDKRKQALIDLTQMLRSREK